MNSPPGMDLASLLSALRRRVWLLVSITVVAAGLAFGLSHLQAERYVATASLLFTSDVNANAPERSAATDVALANLEAVVVGVRRQLGLTEVSLDTLRDRVDLRPDGQADLLKVAASGKTPVDAARLANAFASQIVTVRRNAAVAKIDRDITSLNARIDETDPTPELSAAFLERREALLIDRTLADGRVEIADDATPPRRRAAPRPVRNAAIAAVLGLVLAVMLVVMLRALDRRMSEPEVAELFDTPILARVPANGSSAWRQQLYQEAFQFLRANVVAQMAERADSLAPRALRDEDGMGRLLVVTSSLPAEGKSTTVVLLGRAIAGTGVSVLAVDGDLRKPDLARGFDLEDAPGLVEVLRGDSRPSAVVQQTSVTGLSVLAGGAWNPGMSMQVVNPRRLVQTIELLRLRADILLVDTAPVTIAAETSVLAAKAGGVIVVVDARNLDRATLTATRDQLQRAGASIFGLVVNFVDPPHERALREAYGGRYFDQENASEASAPDEDARATRAERSRTSTGQSS